MTFWRAMRRGEIRAAFHTPRGYARFRADDIDAYARRLTADWRDPSDAPAGY